MKLVIEIEGTAFDLLWFFRQIAISSVVFAGRDRLNVCSAQILDGRRNRVMSLDAVEETGRVPTDILNRVTKKKGKARS